METELKSEMGTEMDSEKEIPLYLFTGFLEAGKTRFIQGTLEDPRFCEGENTLLLVCEEGEIEYEPEKFCNKNIHIEYIDDASKLAVEDLSALVEKYDAKRVLIEYNGMWDMEELFYGMPDDWMIYQEFMFADASTFVQYNKNMRQQMFNKLKTCDCIVLNRYDDSMDIMELHKIIRGANRTCDIVYERPDGSVIPDDIVDPLPFDFDAEIMEIDDRDYALWYRDMGEDMDKYRGKKVRVKGICANSSRLPEGVFVIGRQVMTCCEADIKPAGIACEMYGPKPEPRSWVYITAEIDIKTSPAYGGKEGPVLMVERLEAAEPPEELVVTFY